MSTETTALTTVQPVGNMADFAMSVQDVLRQALLIQQVMGSVMKDGEHYGVVPGTSGKKSLFKSGAEKLSFVFQLSNKLEITVDNLPGGHREYRIICNLYDRSGNLRGQGVGSASTMESKHRYRGPAGKPCPSCGAMSCKASKKEYGGGFYCDSKAGGCNARFKANSPEAKQLDQMPSAKAENPDPADQYNTVLKMAKKRALVDAVLTATAASDIFAQDLEDLEDKTDHDEAPAVAQPKAATPATTAEPEPAPAKKANGNATAPAPSRHPAIVALQTLYRNLGKVDKDLAGRVYDRVCRLFDVDAAPKIPADQMEALDMVVGRLNLHPDDIETMLAAWEEEKAEKEAAK